MSFSAEHSDTSNSSQTLKDLIESTRNVFPTAVDDFHKHVGIGTNMACESYKQVDPSGKNPDCFADSSSCSIAMYTDEKLNIEADGPDNGVCDMGGFYCCRGTRSGAIDAPYECGSMSVCEECRAHHDPTCLCKTQSYDSESETDEPVIDGPVPYVPPGIFGIRRGNGWVVKMADTKTGGYEITSYLDAIKVHSKFLETGDSRADAWFALASHMPDRTSYIQPVVELSS